VKNKKLKNKIIKTTTTTVKETVGNIRYKTQNEDKTKTERRQNEDKAKTERRQNEDRMKTEN
jgi:hypothetical protein